MIPLIFSCIKLINAIPQLQNIEERKEGGEGGKKNCSRNTGHNKGKK